MVNAGWWFASQYENGTHERSLSMLYVRFEVPFLESFPRGKKLALCGGEQILLQTDEDDQEGDEDEDDEDDDLDHDDEEEKR